MLGVPWRVANKTWIVVAHRAGARFIDEVDEALRVFDTVDFPEGRSHDGLPPSDPGRASDSQRGRQEPRESAREHAASVFAGQLAGMLQQGRNAKRFDEVVLIAPPRFLGALRHALDTPTAAMVRGTLDKDYAGLDDRELLRRLEKM
jgi:protein required for attachment to host cells